MADNNQNPSPFQRIKSFYLENRIRFMAPWWHDIYIPELGKSTFNICGIDKRVLASQYQTFGFPSEVYQKLGLGELEGKKILEIGPSSGYYGLELSKKNQVVSIEKSGRFVRQLNFLKRHFNMANWQIVKGEFPRAMPSGQFDTILCLGVLYYYPNETYLPFIENLQKISPGLIYLETLVLKNSQVPYPQPDGRLAFSENELEGRLINQFKGYRVGNRVNLLDSSNPSYNKLSRYRSVIVFIKS